LSQIHETLKNIEFKTIKGADFLLVNNDETNILGFSTVGNLQALCGLNTIFVDGTFKSFPTLFYPLFTIHGVLNNSYISLVYFLLPSKSINCHTYEFRYLVEECRKNDMQFNPVRIYVGFEKAIQVVIYSSKDS